MSIIKNISSQKKKKDMLKQIIGQGLSDDDKELLYTLKLDDPKRLIEFIIKSYFKQLENFSSKLGELQELDLKNQLSDVSNANAMLNNTYNNKKVQIDMYLQSFNDLQRSIYNMIKCNEMYINNIIQIDKREMWEALLNFQTGYYDAIQYSYLARVSLEGIISGIALLYKFAKVLEMDIRYGVAKDFSSYITDILLTGDKCIIMSKYDVKYKDFWLTVSDKALEQLSVDNISHSYFIGIKEDGLKENEIDDIEIIF